MSHEGYTVAEHNFVGHQAEPDAGSNRAVIVDKESVFFDRSERAVVVWIKEE